MVNTGQILTSWQTGTALGIAFSGAIPLIVPGSWRFQISSSFIPAAMLLVLVYAGSESPRWLIKKQRYAEVSIQFTCEARNFLGYLMDAC